MADNYLERQREAYEARKAEWLKAKRLGKVGRRVVKSVKSSEPSHTSGSKE